MNPSLLNSNNQIKDTRYNPRTVNQIGLLFFIAQNQKERTKKIKNIEKNFNERRNQADTKQKKKLISQQKKEARKKRDRRLYEKGGNYGIQRY